MRGVICLGVPSTQMKPKRMRPTTLWATVRGRKVPGNSRKWGGENSVCILEREGVMKREISARGMKDTIEAYSKVCYHVI